MNHSQAEFHHNGVSQFGERRLSLHENGFLYMFRCPTPTLRRRRNGYRQLLSLKVPQPAPPRENPCDQNAENKVFVASASCGCRGLSENLR